MMTQRDIWADDIETHEPNSGHEANLTKWGWPSPALLKRHARSVVKREPTPVPYDGHGECPF